MDDAAIHRVSEDAVRECSSVNEEQRIPTLFAFVFVPSCKLNHFPASQQ